MPRLVEDMLVNMRIEKISSQSLILKNHLISENYYNTGESSIISTEIDHISTLYDCRVEIIDSNLNIVKDTYVIDEGKISVNPTVIQCFRQGNVTDYNREDNCIDYAVSISTENEEGTTFLGVLYIVIDLTDVELVVDDLMETLYMCSVICLLIGLVASYVFAGHVLQPFKTVGESIRHIAEGNLEDELPQQGYKETAEIEEPFHRLLSRLKQLEESRQEFVSNVSHELKTPITSIKVLADSLLLQEDLPAELYREFMTDIVAEIDRENEIITDLLAMVKLDKNNVPLNIDKINMNNMIELILKRLRPIAAKQNIELVFESFRPVIADVDEVKMTMAITNLVENAIKYNVLDGWVRVSLNADHKYMYITVADSGIGIPQESQTMIFERFYRVDKARSRETGGTGLGLSITRNIIVMHNGDVKLHSRENEGTTFTVRIPLNYVKQ